MAKESEPEKQITSTKIRIESLSDLVFGLALSVGAISLIINLNPSKTPNITTISTSIGIFGFSFIIIIMIWIGFTRTMSILAAETRYAFFLNLVLLFCIVIEPYLLYILSAYNSFQLADFSSSLYALDLGSMFCILANLARMVCKQENLKLEGVKGPFKLHPTLLRRFKRIMTTEYIIGGVYMLSAIPYFFLIETPIGPIRFAFWYSSFALFFALRSSRINKAGERNDPLGSDSQLSEVPPKSS